MLILPRSPSPRSPTRATDKQTLALRADIEKLEDKMEFRVFGDGEFHDAARSMIDIANAALGAGNKSFLGALAAQQAATHLDKAVKNTQKSQEGLRDALKVLKKAMKATKEAQVWLEVCCTLMEDGDADVETQVAQKGLHDAGQEKEL